MKKTYYLDSSALVKRYFQESGSPTVDQLFSADSLFMTASLTYAELYATVHRLYREGFLSIKNREGLLQSFEKDWKKFGIIDFSPEVRRWIPHLSKKFPLRGADAVHLASAVTLLERGVHLQFLASDKKLLHAAEDYGFQILDPTAG